MRYAVLISMMCALGAGLLGCGGGGSGGDTGTERKQIASVRLAAGDGQSATVGTELPNPLVAQLLDSSGQPIAGQVVNFRVTTGGGSVFAGAASSDAGGIVRERWTLGTGAGPQRVEVRAIDSQGTAVTYAAFDAIAVPGPAVAVTIVAGHGQTAAQLQPLPLPVKAAISDRYGNAVVGTLVSFDAGAGTASPALVLSDALGEASTQWTLGPALGTQTLIASVAGGHAVAFGADATQAAPSAPVAMQLVSGDAQTLAQHTKLAADLTVKVIDVLGNGVPGETVEFAAAPGSGYVRPVTAVTNAAGFAGWRGYVHMSGTQQVVALFAGLPSVTFSLQVTPAGHPFDGVYFGATQLVNDTILIANLPPQVGAFSEATGSLFFLQHPALDFRDFQRGTLVMDASGRVSGSGTIEQSVRGGPFTVTGTWSCGIPTNGSCRE